MSNKRVKIAPSGRWDAQKARALYPYRYALKGIIMRKIAISLFCILLTGCPYTTAFIIDENEKYTPTQSVEVLVETPNKPYKEIAILEARGELHDSIPNLLKSLRNKAKSIGADAIVPSEVTGKEIKQGLIYNPWLGGYHTTAGGTVPIMRAVAIKYVE